ncbi:1-aminocyclopropane-1-carboxylate deaminase/D-cysteine desulfhydrase [Marinobacterium weihaiense]|uniref:Pyridoxal-phosphate dependent enzyme n=1 Tax=Marinobacterium weihaiense TaxID=2851016 RepID=A0ABS6M8R0_9GAMM|nr:pyridoxal-phosphate dependent enzyme [Marinobacterium weihaiense]MBV0932276.1 pyridoxal-phosphate dependent enzyme [Marinobacterium weihaiense]
MSVSGLVVTPDAVVLQALSSPFLDHFNIDLSVLRLDGIHPAISGNKWFKLMPALEQAQRQNKPILSFGGAWSNHIHALAWAGHVLGIPTTGVVRGEADYARNAMLSDARRWGMRLHFVTREDYRRRHEAGYQQVLLRRLGDAVVVPEGGSTLASVRSVADIWRLPALSAVTCDVLVTAVGTGATLSGLVLGRPPGVHVLGVPVLKYDQRLSQTVQSWLQALKVADEGWSFVSGGHGGGYARINAELARLIQEAEQHFNLPLDPVYTAKAMHALHRQIVQGRIKPGSHVVLLHTGGLQGKRGLQAQLDDLAPAFTGPLAL